MKLSDFSFYLISRIMCKFEENPPIRGGARPLVLGDIFRGQGISNVILEFVCFLRVLTRQECKERTSIAICNQNGIKWAHFEQRRTQVHIMGGDIYWRGLAASTKLPTWFRLCTISNLMDTVRFLALLTVHTIMRHHTDPKSWRKAFRKFSKNSLQFPHFISLNTPMIFHFLISCFDML